MATSNGSLPRIGKMFLRQRKLLSFASTRIRLLLRSSYAGWIVTIILLTYILTSHLIISRTPSFPATLLERDFDHDITAHNESEAQSARLSAALLQDNEIIQNRVKASQNTNSSISTSLGNHFCILQPTLSSGKSKWTTDDVKNHIALRAFMTTFAKTVTPSERNYMKFSVYYGHDSDDAVFGDPKLRNVFQEHAHSILTDAGFKPNDVNLIFTPLYGLHGRINAIWNVLAKDAYYDGCDYFFLSNDDMVFFTKGWVASAKDSLNGIGSMAGHKRPCRYFGIVRFKDEWATWATFTFHVSTRMHLEIFGGIYYPVPYNSAHNDYWINLVYRQFDASKYRGEVKVRNRVEDVDYALKHPKDTKRVAPPRYSYDKRGDVRKYVLEGRARVQAWLDRYKHTSRCPLPL